ncbi:MAG TPA: acyltransferase family protein [Microbacteriaceae bacterium]
MSFSETAIDLSALKERSGAIDAVRVVGVIAVVAGHTLGTPFVHTLVYSWHVPLFFFLAGYFWSPRSSLTQELAKRTRTLVVPYLTWFVLIALAFVTLDSTLESSTVARLFAPFSNGQDSAMPYTTFWFVAVLFFSLILLRCLWWLPRTVVWAIAIGGALLGYFAGDTLAETPLAIGSALPCLIFVLLGTAARSVRPRIAQPGLVGLALLLASAVLVVGGLSSPLDIKQGDFGTPLLSTVVAVMISFGLLLVAESVFGRMPGSVSRLATRLSCACFMVVLLHPLVMWLMLTFGPTVPDWQLFVITAAIPLLAAMLALRSAASFWLTGVDRVPAAVS